MLLPELYPTIKSMVNENANLKESYFFDTAFLNNFYSIQSLSRQVQCTPNDSVGSFTHLANELEVFDVSESSVVFG